MTHCERDDVVAANIEVHRLEAPYYDALHYEENNFYERSRRRRAIEEAKRILEGRRHGLKALDVGCGTGKMSLMLAEAAFEVFSMDLSFEMLAVFREKLRQRKVDPEPRLICADMFTFLADCRERFDLIVFCGILHHVVDVPEAIRLASARLNDGGVIMITHEPLKQTISSKTRYMFHRALAAPDEALYRFCIRRLPDEAKSIDYSMSDFQRQFGGIDAKMVVSELKDNGLSVISERKYCARRFGLSCMIANTLIRSQNTFQIIARLG
ncbi:MAG: methyltransferase domain-containing protein [Candidatus Coatesbacteria bacterium]|nr:methyltransferase domain-containing protein [Candidatus Coatesbacteria bacterium]